MKYETLSTKGCASCESMLVQMGKRKYTFKPQRLAESPENMEQLKSSIPSTLDSIPMPIFNLYGRL